MAKKAKLDDVLKELKEHKELLKRQNRIAHRELIVLYVFSGYLIYFTVLIALLAAKFLSLAPSLVAALVVLVVILVALKYLLSKYAIK